MLALLDHILLISPEPERLARFYQDVMGMTQEGRPTGIWRHEPDTLNRWGQSFMRN